MLFFLGGAVFEMCVRQFIQCMLASFPSFTLIILYYCNSANWSCYPAKLYVFYGGVKIFSDKRNVHPFSETFIHF